MLSKAYIFFSWALLLGRSLSSPVAGPYARVNLRVEGLDSTIFEGTLLTAGHNVTTEAGGSHHCDGTNLGTNPSPGPAATASLDTAAKLAHFTFDGTYDSSYDDFFITRVASSAQNDASGQYWGILLDYQYTPVGGCQQRVQNGDDILFAFDSFNKVHILKASGPHTAHVGTPVVVTVVDGSSGSAVDGAEVGGVLTDGNGNASVSFTSPGLHTLKAEKADSIRSNSLRILVLP